MGREQVINSSCVRTIFGVDSIDGISISVPNTNRTTIPDFPFAFGVCFD